MKSGSQLFLNGLNGVGLQLTYNEGEITLIRREAFADWRSNPLITEVEGKPVAIGEASINAVLRAVDAWLRDQDILDD